MLLEIQIPRPVSVIMRTLTYLRKYRVQAANPSMGRNLPMRISVSGTTDLIFSLWRILVPTRKSTHSTYNTICKTLSCRSVYSAKTSIPTIESVIIRLTYLCRNGSQFFITTVPTPHLNGKHVVFGEVIQGQELIQAVESCGTSSGKPSEKIKIVRCGTV